MTREDAQLKLSLPKAIRDAIWKASVANKRTMNDELVARLERSVAEAPTSPQADPSLVGMFFVRDGGEFYATGEILSEVKDGIFLISTDAPPNTVPIRPLEIMSIEDMLGFGENGIPVMSLFRTRADLDAWIKWLSAPEKPSVINLVKPPK